jgi:biopolymer transport protein TolR
MITNYRYSKKVDVIPVINVSLVVVLTLMLIAPHLNNSVQQVDLPEATADEVDDTDNIEITYALDGTIYLGEEAVELGDVRPLLSAVFDLNPEAVAVIKADRSLLYGDVERLIGEVEAAEAPRIAIATRNKQSSDGGTP